MTTRKELRHDLALWESLPESRTRTARLMQLKVELSLFEPTHTVTLSCGHKFQMIEPPDIGDRSGCWSSCTTEEDDWRYVVKVKPNES